MTRIPQNPYARFREHSLTLNDYLAIDRTVLANERTLLSYVRTALTQIIMGGSALKFFDSRALTVAGIVLLVGGAATLWVGGFRYRHTSRLLRAALESQTGEKEHPLEDDLERAAEEKKQHETPES